MRRGGGGVGERSYAGGSFWLEKSLFMAGYGVQAEPGVERKGAGGKLCRLFFGLRRVFYWRRGECRQQQAFGMLIDAHLFATRR